MNGVSHYVLSFDSTHLAMAADCALGEEGVGFAMLPTPKQISAGCGIALRLAPEDFERALSCLSRQEPPIAAHAFRVTVGGEYAACGES